MYFELGWVGKGEEYRAVDMNLKNGVGGFLLSKWCLGILALVGIGVFV